MHKLDGLYLKKHFSISSFIAPYLIEFNSPYILLVSIRSFIWKKNFTKYNNLWM